MALSNDLLMQFAKATTKKKEATKESTVYGTMVTYNGDLYVQLDGSDLLTPASTTTNAKEGDRVTVLIKDHSAVVTGNLSSPSATDKEVKEVGSKITEFEIACSNLSIIADILGFEKILCCLNPCLPQS